MSSLVTAIAARIPASLETLGSLNVVPNLLSNATQWAHHGGFCVPSRCNFKLKNPSGTTRRTNHGRSILDDWQSGAEPVREEGKIILALAGREPTTALVICPQEPGFADDVNLSTNHCWICTITKHNTSGPVEAERRVIKMAQSHV